MATSVPHSAVTAMAAANAAAAAAIGSSTSASVPVGPLLLAEQANKLRLMAVYDRLSQCLNGGSRMENSDVYEWRKNANLQSAIMMVLISIKNACKRGWFRTVDAEELLCMVDEMCSKFCTELCPNTHVSHALNTISKIMPRFYPRLMLQSLIVSFEAKPGYDVLMSDFHFPKGHHPEQNIMLIVVKTQNLETSSCITNPQASFLVNGKGVEKRNNVSLDCGPQLPTDISKMLKYGINVLQTIGYFDGAYLIAIAYMSKMPNCTPELKDYVQPVIAALDSDSEIIEGPSRISLSCPISFKRMRTPAKGHLCKHHQCFDYENFLEMNSRKPNWRCPHCNQPVCMIDLRVDRNMVKILEEVREDVTEVVIHADGSWNVVAEQGRCSDELHDGTQVHDHADSMECETNKSKISMADLVDLTMEEDDNYDITQTTIRREASLDGCASQSCDHILEIEDRKPSIDFGCIPVPQLLSNPALANHASNPAQVPVYQIGDTIQQAFMSSYATNGSVASAGSPHMGSSQSLPPNMLGNLVHSDAVSPLLDQTPLAVHVLPVGNNLTERITGRPPRNADRAPVAVQALPVPQQTHNTSRRLHANLPDTQLASNLSPRQYQTVNVSNHLENFSGGIGNMDMQQGIRTADTSAMQDHILNEAVLQQGIGLPSPSTLNGRSPFSHRRGPTDVDAFRASLQSSPFSRNSLQTPPGFRSHQSMSQAMNLPSQSPSLPSVVRQASHNTIGLAASNFGNQRNHTQASLPPQSLRSLPTSTANSMQSRENSRVVGADRWRSLTGGMPSPLSRPEGIPELPHEQNWRPTGRMRGSLTGSDYSAVISNYMPPLNQSGTARPSTVPSSSDQVSALIANNLMTRGAVNHQTSSSQDNVGSQQGDARI
ncbi:hypothetical protein IEQ34_020163 [Dendrobium chrysotoxum]|uniref:SP-RING-type domain-containing protein n=1 Tax=Dendrobium chrysotoxum TaxID=161865 RepID=A0AAV7FZS3_DENCH|nr:hypothetical protein IEQ34_020163 [Dendrobium chrysotoxum]